MEPTRSAGSLRKWREKRMTKVDEHKTLGVGLLPSIKVELDA